MICEAANNVARNRKCLESMTFGPLKRIFVRVLSEYSNGMQTLVIMGLVSIALSVTREALRLLMIWNLLK